jgi:hypothetical protein
MKKIFTSIFVLILSLPAFSQTNYPGNQKTSFGGPVGTGSLDVSMTGTILTVTLNRGGANMNDALVLYIDAGTGGFTTTASFMDASTALTRAISGFDGAMNRSTLTFNPTFSPDYAIAMMPNNSEGAVLVQLGSAFHIPLGMPALTNNGNPAAANYTMSIDLAGLGVTGSFTFQFVGTLVSSTGFRSNEAIGMSMDGFTQGWNPYTQTTNALLFTASLPVVLSGFTGYIKGQSAELSWETKTESNLKTFVVEKSTGGRDWSTIGSVVPANRTEGAKYSFSDNSVAAKTNLYRLKMMDKDGSVKMSNILKLQSNTKAGVILMGNPVNDAVKLNISNEIATRYNINLITVDGKRISTMTYIHSGGTSSLAVPVPAGVKGACILRVQDNNDVQNIPVFVQ